MSPDSVPVILLHLQRVGCGVHCTDPFPLIYCMFPGSVRLYVNLTFIQAFPIYFTAHEPISDHFSLNRRPPDYYLALPEKPPPGELLPGGKD